MTALLVGIVIGLVSARVVWQWVSAIPYTERMARILAVSSPADATTFLRLLADNTVRGGCKVVGAYECYALDGWYMKITISGVDVTTPKRDTPEECLQDLPKFQAQIEALRAVK